MFAEMAAFMTLFEGRLGADEKVVIQMYLLGQTVPRHPGILEEFNHFSHHFSDVYDDWEEKNQSGDVSEAMKFEDVVLPDTLPPSQREPDTWMEIVRIHGAETLPRLAQIMSKMSRDVRRNYRDRIIKEQLVQGARSLHVPDDLIEATCEEDN